VYLHKCIHPNISGKHERLHIRSTVFLKPTHAHNTKDIGTEKHLPQEQIGLLGVVCVYIKNYDGGVSRTRRLEGKGQAGGAHRLARYLQVTHMERKKRVKK
jgi:hypothetical protein